MSAGQLIDTRPRSEAGGRSLGWWDAGLFGAAVLVNVPLVHQYMGPLPTALYAVAMLAGFAAAAWVVLHRSASTVRRALLCGIGLSMAAQLLALWALGPQFDARVDRDSALTVWLAAVARGEFPYALPTDRGSPLSVMPLMPVVAIPFVLVGNVGYLEVCGYGCLAILLWRRYRHAPRLQALSLIALSSAPLVFFEVIARSELIANMALLMLVLTWVQANEARLTGRRILLLGGSLGCLAATRLALVPALALVGLAVVRRLDARARVLLTTTALGLFTILVLPFLLWDPATFVHYAPLGVNDARLGTALPARLGWSVVTGLVVGLSILAAKRAGDLFLLQVPVMAVVVLAAWLNVWPSFPLDLSYLQLIFVPLLFGFPPSASHRLHFFSFTLPISNPTSNGWRHRKDGATGRQAGGDASYTREGLRSQRTLVPDQARLHSSVRAVATRLAAAPESLKGEQETQSVTSEELAGGCTRTER